jgi:hypothetical protein
MPGYVVPGTAGGYSFGVECELQLPILRMLSEDVAFERDGSDGTFFFVDASKAVDGSGLTGTAGIIANQSFPVLDFHFTGNVSCLAANSDRKGWEIQTLFRFLSVG